MTTVGLSMITRDAAEWLPACVGSAKPVVSEIFVADTGSSDATISIAQSLGARVIQIPWKNDFAEARNLCLKEMSADWILSLDADEMLDPAAVSQIKSLLATARAGGFQVTIRNYVLSLQDRIWDRAAIPNVSSIPAAAKYPAYVEHENVRLFRRDSEIHFVGRVHESVGPRLLELGRKIETAPFFIHHFGLAASAETREHKNRFYRELGREKVRERPRDAQAHLELGLVEMDNFGNLDEALRLFRRACELNPGFGIAWFFLGIAHLRKSSYREALRAFDRAARSGHQTALLAESKGDALYNSGDFRSAAKSYAVAAQREAENPVFASKLGFALVRAGDADAGLERLLLARDSRATSPELHDRLILALVFLNRYAEAAKAAEEKLGGVDLPQHLDFLRAATLWSKAGDPARAAAMLQVGLQVYPHNKDLLAALEELAQSIGIKEFSSHLDSTT